MTIAVRFERIRSAERLAARLGLQRKAQAAAGHDSTEHSRLLSLQRRAGNRAVTSLLQGGAGATVQRAFSVKPSTLEANRSTGDRIRTAFASDTYSMVIEALRDFGKARDAKRKLYLARVIEWRTDDWLQRHGDRRTSKDRQRKAAIEQLNLEAKREVGILRAQAVYTRDMQGDAGLLEGGPGQLKGLNPTAKRSGLYAEKAVGLGGGDVPGGQGADAAAAEVVKKYNLSAAEIAAIRTYTLPDYAYINPATANSDAWLRSNVAEAKGADHLKQLGAAANPLSVDDLGPGLKLLKQEGALHAGMLAQAASKLPKYTRPAFRGQRLSEDAFHDKFMGNRGKPMKYTAFSSASKSEAIARGYADGTAGDIRPRKDETVSVLYEIAMIDGRDISALSAALSKDEQEVLILPGAEMQVLSVIPVFTGPEGAPPATRWYRVKLQQVR